MSQATTSPGVVGIKVSILPPNAHIHDRIVIEEAMLAKLKARANPPEVHEKEEGETHASKPKRKKKADKAGEEQ